MFLSSYLGAEAMSSRRCMFMSRKRWFETYSKRFVDRLRLVIRGGNGGQGCVSWEPIWGARSGYHKRADGGNGGRGGSVSIRACESLDSLTAGGKTVVRGNSGSNGGSCLMHGANASGIWFDVPVGTIVRVAPGDSWGTDFWGEFEIERELVVPGETILVAEGGVGGKGNARLNWRRIDARNFEQGVTFGHIPPRPGEAKLVELELKTIADVGLIGKPNAGKSSLLRALSNAEPEIADYPFTTLRPHVGVCEFRRRDNRNKDVIRIADVPGLIEGAAQGKGLGLDFLRHISRTRALVFVVDASNGTRQAIDDLNTVVKEIASSAEFVEQEEDGSSSPEDAWLNENMLLPSITKESLPPKDTTKRPALLYANKLDLVEDPVARQTILDELAGAIRNYSAENPTLPADFKQVLGGSAKTGLDVPKLAVRLRNLVRVDLPEQIRRNSSSEEERSEATSSVV